MRRIFFIAMALFAIGLLPSCLSPKKLYYFHDQQVTKHQLDSVEQSAHLIIQKGNRLHITVTSPDPSVTAYLNPYNMSGSGSANQQSMSGFLVSQDGTITFPMVGELEVAGLNTVEASKLLSEKLAVFYKDVFVNIIINGRVYFLNGRSGQVVQLSNERLTIFEGLTQMGIQDPYDIKDKVWLVREENGQREYAQLNLNSKEIFTSPYYYLHNNDLVYVKPSRMSSFLSPNSPLRNILTISGVALTLFLILRTR
ncbi:MAG TPA: polysaccharide biosynthesis/export family protein [Ferruginibacter sp.]|nr:polysaccharide biosynthesis/export family protein [Ferruginibacter sp.]HRO17820.1 polysaccharide biosynthesis/export family protein [Ferruginibacter sp.]HRQ21256.1 polysaccharide biosynthesis/export family protein [Ferruginibacter sp.]